MAQQLELEIFLGDDARGCGSVSAPDLEGRVALVTGAGGGLGAGICSALASAGASVAAVDVVRDKAERVAADLSRTGARCVALQTDVSDRSSVEATVERVADELGGVDILINNAAIYPRRAWTEIQEEEWDRVMAVNLKGYFLCARAVYPHMKSKGRGHIVNVASITFFIGWTLLMDYVASKGGIIGFTRTLSREVGPDNINVNAIAQAPSPRTPRRSTPTRRAITAGSWSSNPSSAAAHRKTSATSSPSSPPTHPPSSQARRSRSTAAG